jgi:hypothetical protein
MTPLLLGALLQIAAAATPAGSPPEMIGPPECRQLVIQVVDGATKKSIKGARVMELSLDPPDRALSMFLAKRVGLTGENGVLDLGFIPAAAPSQVRVSASGFRTATLKLGARFEEGKRDVVLTPNQDVEVRVTGLAGRRGDARPEVSLVRCQDQEMGSFCSEPGVARTIPLTADEKARFQGVEGGFHRVELRAPGIGVTHRTIEVASEGDVRSVVVDFAVAEWTFKGTTHLHDGTPVAAAVSAAEAVPREGATLAGTTASGADGSFELRVLSTSGNSIGFHAEASEPKAVTRPNQNIQLSEEAHLVEGIDLELDATGLEIQVRDSKSNETLPGCSITLVTSSFSRTAGGVTDSSGVFRDYGLAEGVRSLKVRCEKHYAKDLGQVDVVPDEIRHLDVLVDSSRDLILAALDEGGSPVSDAIVLVSAAASATYPLVNMGTQAGTTDGQGEIVLHGEEFAGMAAYLVAPGRALATVVLPASCDSPESCRIPVIVHAPPAFAGLVVRKESGKASNPWFLSFTREGITIPWNVMQEVLSANGIAMDAPANPIEIHAAGLLPEGTYVVTVPHRRPDSRATTPEWTAATIGTFNVPSVERVELLDSDGVPPPILPPSQRTHEVIGAQDRTPGNAGVERPELLVVQAVCLDADRPRRL